MKDRKKRKREKEVKQITKIPDDVTIEIDNVDVYVDEDLEKLGKKSVSIGLRFNSSKRQLTKKDAAVYRKIIGDDLYEKFGALFSHEVCKKCGSFLPKEI